MPSVRIERVAREAIDRVRCPAGLLAFALLSGVGLVRTAAQHDLIDASVGWAMDGLRHVDDGLAREAEPAAEAIVDRLHLALGLEPWLAAMLWLVTVGCTAVIVVLAIAAFASDAGRFRDLRTPGVGRKAGRVLLGSMLATVLVTMGFAVFVLPGMVVMVGLVYFPVAIVVDDEPLLESWRRSVGVARRIPGETIAIVVIGVVVTGAGAAAGTLFRLFLPDVAGVVANVVLVTAAWLWIGALVTRTYLAARPAAPASEAPR